ncbi:hypothetical protein Ga0074812_12597 [Parafrankia irregularis]|uniref:Uncharacterized protein n=1 Tax=Parafrankia irregularis TaxID=795642 RepID=A0A0S4QXE0_9ACTN|nr:hypothetical protein Ga0074812_12597 [Parafrankia irregularis]
MTIITDAADTAVVSLEEPTTERRGGPEGTRFRSRRRWIRIR